MKIGLEKRTINRLLDIFSINMGEITSSFLYVVSPEGSKIREDWRTTLTKVRGQRQS